MIFKLVPFKKWMHDEFFSLKEKLKNFNEFRDGPLEKWWGGGGGEFSACTNLFFRSLLEQECFFQVIPSARFFFFRQILLFFEQWNLDSLSMFLCFINYSTLTTDQRIQATLMQNLFKNVHTVREEEATWSGRPPCAFFQSLPSEMPYSVHQWKPYLDPVYMEWGTPV